MQTSCKFSWKAYAETHNIMISISADSVVWSNRICWRLKEDADALLTELGAPEHLITHAKWADESAEILFKAPRALVIEDLARTGVFLYNVSKIYHPSELSQPRNQHETTDYLLLFEEGADLIIARYYLSHARWDTTRITLEEFTIVLSDKL